MPSTFYVIQVKTRGEQKYLNFALPITETRNVQILWPRRSLRIRKRGKWHEVQNPIFPGYLFLEVEELDPQLYWDLKKIPGFFRFLKNNHDIQAMPEPDARILANLLRFGEVVKKSVAAFDEGGRIRIIEGPLKGMEGRIAKVDKRKGRAKIKLALYENSYVVDFGFQSIEKAKDNEDSAKNSE